MKLPEKAEHQELAGGWAFQERASTLNEVLKTTNEIIDYLQHLDNRIQTLSLNQLEMKRGDRMITVTIPSEQPKRWRAMIGEKYFRVDEWGIVDNCQECGDGCDNFRYAIGNYFKTEEEAYAYKEKLLEMGRNSN